MIPALTTTIPKPAETPDAISSGFRLGDDHESDASDSDQSAHSERSLSPSKAEAKASKSKKRRVLRQERKQVGALTDELGTLLGAAFQAPDGDSEKTVGEVAEVTADQIMEVEMTPAEKKLPKRTRQNIAKMEKRRLARERQQQGKLHQQSAAVERKVLPSGQQQRRQKQSKKNSTQARRQRKEKQRAREAMGQGDAMEIG